MTRTTCLLLLLAVLSGCAAPRAALPTSALPGTLGDVNADLRGAVVQIDFADGSSIARAERVRVREVVTEYTAERMGGPTQQSVPTADVVRITVVSGRASGARGALVGALPGGLLALGSALALSDPSEEASLEDVVTGLLASLALVAGVGLAVVGGAVGAAAQGNRAPGRYVVLYHGPVDRYLSAPDSTVSPPSDPPLDR